MPYIILILIFVCLLIYMSMRKKSNQQEMTASNDADILDRKKELGASEGIGLKNLSGFSLTAGYLCGIYLFKDKTLFESKGLFLEIPHKWLERVFIETQSYNAMLRNYKPELSPYNSKRFSDEKPDPEAEFITELTLVYEFRWNNSTSDKAVFAVSHDHFQDVKRFVERCDEYRKRVSSEKDNPG